MKDTGVVSLFSKARPCGHGAAFWTPPPQLDGRDATHTHTHTRDPHRPVVKSMDSRMVFRYI